MLKFFSFSSSSLITSFTGNEAPQLKKELG